MDISDIGTIVYMIMALFIARPVAGHVAWKEKFSWHEKPEGEDWFLGWLAGIGVGLLWPIAILAWLANKSTGKLMPAIGAEKAAIEERREKEQQKEIERLRQRDRDLGLEPYDYGQLSK